MEAERRRPATARGLDIDLRSKCQNHPGPRRRRVNNVRFISFSNAS